MATLSALSTAQLNLLHQNSMQSFFRRASKKDRSVDTHPLASTIPPTRRPDRLTNVARDPPPAYSAETPPAPPSYTEAPASSSIAAPQVYADDAYSFLREFDTIFLIDDSGSMAGSRWREASEAIATIAPICTSHDADGIDIHFFNASTQPSHIGIKRAASVREVFDQVKPGGGTPTGQRIRSLLVPYLRRYEFKPEQTKPINIICITDGDAHDDVESPLIEAAKKLDALNAPAWQVGVQFFQIGNDASATELLKYLDDELASGNGSMRDIVDTVPYRGRQGGTLSADGVLKVVLGSVNRRLDRRRADLHCSPP